MPLSRTIHQELNLLTSTGGCGGCKGEYGFKWCFGEVEDGAMFTVTPPNHDSDPTNDSISGSVVEDDDDTCSDGDTDIF
jgi:hypothetical protein